MEEVVGRRPPVSFIHSFTLALILARNFVRNMVIAAAPTPGYLRSTQHFLEIRGTRRLP